MMRKDPIPIPLDYDRGGAEIERWKLGIALVFLLVMALLYTVNSCMPGNNPASNPTIAAELAKWRALDAYTREADAAIIQMQIDQPKGQARLAAAVAKARAAGVLPTSPPVPFPSGGELELAKAYVLGNDQSPEATAFLAYIHSTYPSFQIDSMKWYWRKNTTHPATTPATTLGVRGKS